MLHNLVENIPEVPDCFYRVSIKALILDEEKRFLLIQENNGRWELPGGGLNFGEQPHACLTREINEEMAIPITHIADRPSYFFVASRRNGAHWSSNIVYETTVDHLEFSPSDECVAVRFFTTQEALQENLFSNVVEFCRLFNPDNHGGKN
jgi:8-oxo-dGTP pyrophosphatase MutT (NUDIX family)